MEIKRTTEIFIETNKRFVIRQPESSEQVFCRQCTEPMLTAEQTAALLNISHRAVYQIVENGTAHFLETETGVLLVCPNSFAETLTNYK